MSSSGWKWPQKIDWSKVDENRPETEEERNARLDEEARDDSMTAAFGKAYGASDETIQKVLQRKKDGR